MPGCVMSLPTNSGGKKYTVEQAELIRRLRNSGMTKEQVLMAFDSFDLIDQCIGSIVNISSLAQKTVINSSSVAVLAENLISRQAVIPNIQSSNTNLTTNLSTSLLSSIKIPHITSPLLSPIIPVTLPQLPSVNQTPISPISATVVTPITSVVAITGNALQLQLSVANSQQSSGASQQLQQQVQVMQVLQQLGLLGAAVSNSITPVSIAKGLTATSLTSSIPLNLSQAVSQSLLSSQLHHHQQSQSSQLLSPTLPQQQQSQLALQLQQLPQHLQTQLQQTHSAQHSTIQTSPAPALVSLPPVFQQLIQQQSQQPQNTIVQQLQQLVALQQLQQVKQIYDSQSSQALITSLIAATSQHQPTSSAAPNTLLPSQLVQLQQLAQLPLQQHMLHQQLQHHPQQTTVSITSSTSTLTSTKITQQVPNIQQQEQLLAQIIKQLHNSTAAAEKQQPPQQPPVTVTTPSSSGSQAVQLIPPFEESLSSVENNDTKQGVGSSGRRSFNFKNGIMKEDLDDDAAFLNQDEILCCEEIKEFTVINNIKQHQIAALTGISQAYISRYLKGEYMGMSDKCCRTIKKWYITYKNNPAAIEENANRQAQLAASRLVDQNESGANSVEMDQSDSYVLPPPIPPVTTVPSTTSSSNLTYPRRERFVFRPNHLELLEKCFMEENYPSLKRREEIAKVCNVATEKLTGRALSDKEKVGVQTISNWFANKRKDLKRLFKEDGMEAASPFLTRSRGRPPLTQSDPHFYSTISSLFNHSSALKIGQRLEQQVLNGLEIGSGNEIMIGQSKENLLLGEAEAAALQLSVETAAVNQAIYSLTGQLPIIPLPPSKKGAPELSQQTAEFLSNLVTNFKNSINGDASKTKTSKPVQSNGARDMEANSDDFMSEAQDVVTDPQMESIVSEDCSEVVLSCENLEDEIIFSNGRQDGDSIFDDIMSGEVAMNCELGSSE